MNPILSLSVIEASCPSATPVAAPPSLPSSALDDAIGREDGGEGEGGVADTGAMEVEDESLKEKGAASGGTRRRRSSRWDVASWERKRMEASAGGGGGIEVTIVPYPIVLPLLGDRFRLLNLSRHHVFPLRSAPCKASRFKSSSAGLGHRSTGSDAPESDGSGWSTVGLVEREVRSPKASRYRYYYLNGELLSLLGLMGWVMAPAVTVSSSMHGALDLSRLLRPWLIRAAAQPFFSLFSLNWCSTLTLMTLSCLGSKKRKEDSPIVLIIES
ncbi:hypothetical protein BHE74_00008416 [Ensete ventricosum]|nr:hypothetical protein BHE74_00008416 [Ensete ventricosum]